MILNFSAIELFGYLQWHSGAVRPHISFVSTSAVQLKIRLSHAHIVFGGDKLRM